jgi:release factor glutamine methyltransferase
MPATIAELLLAARRRLEEADTESSGLDARLLMQAALGVSHEILIADANRTPEPRLLLLFEGLLLRRLAREPVSRILGVREFYGRAFKISPDVLDPRADTETVVELCLGLFGVDREFRFADLGAGSGAIAVTLLAERAAASGTAIDVSPQALAITQFNAARHGVEARLKVVETSWLSGVADDFDLIVANPPYIALEEEASLDAEVRDHDPHLALFGGGDGLDCYRAISGQAAARVRPQGVVVVEIGAGQAKHVAQIFSIAGFDLSQQKVDLGGHIRALAFQKRL